MVIQQLPAHGKEVDSQLQRAVGIFVSAWFQRVLGLPQGFHLGK
jgi:hypothetical protein